MLIFSKFLEVDLCEGLKLSEFRCKCNEKSCKSVLVNPKLITAYGKFRKKIGKALKINSGFRCFIHNLAVGGASLSRHTAGDAIDIDYGNFKNLFEVAEVKKMLRASGFTFIKYYPIEGFFHCDVREFLQDDPRED